MGKICTVTFEGVSVSAAQDLVAIKAASTKPLRILRYWVGSTDNPSVSSGGMKLRARVATATVTLGSGGTAPTPVCIDLTNTTTVSATAHVNDTSGATTSGAFTTIDEQGAHIYTGYESPPWRTLDIPISGGFVWQLVTAPASAVTLSGGVDFEEIG